MKSSQQRGAAGICFLALLLFVAMAVPGRASDAEIMGKLKTRAEVFLNALMTGKASTVRGEMTSTVSTALSDETIRQIFGNLYRDGGRLQRVDPASVREFPDGAVVATVPIHLKKRSVAAQVVFERKASLSKVKGFSIHPYDAPPPGASTPGGSAVAGGGDSVPPPAYADNDLFRETPVEVVSGDYKMAGVLTVPVTASASAPVPGVVLVGGAGGLDADGTIGPNKPFRDLAQGLAARGVAVLRYEKREAAYPERFGEGKTFSVEEAVVEDARAAVDVLRADPRVRTTEVAIAGYDLGGFLAPRVAQESAVSRVLILAAPARFDSAYALDQLDRVISDPSVTDPAQKAMAMDAKLTAEKWRDVGLLEEDQLLGSPGKVWLALEKEQPEKRLAGLRGTVGVILAGGDPLVPEDHVAIWRSGLPEESQTRNIKWITGVNHLLIPTAEVPGVHALAQRGNMDERVVDAAAKFLLTGSF